MIVQLAACRYKYSTTANSLGPHKRAMDDNLLLIKTSTPPP